AEFERDQDLARDPAIRGRPAQRAVRRRRENAAAAPARASAGGGHSLGSERLVAGSAPNLCGRLQAFPARLADRAPQEPIDRAFVAARAAGREEEAGGGSQQRAQISLRETRPASVNIGVGL